MILVTGGTGLVGAHLLYQLCLSKVAIRAIYRSEERIAATKRVFSYYTNDPAPLFNTIEWVQADITDVPSMIPAFKDISIVYHCAAFISFDPKAYITMRKVNIHGTAIMVNLAIDQKVSKFCYVSSIAAVEDGLPGEIVTEDNEWSGNANHSGYAITKYGAEMEVWRASQEGVDMVIVNPGVILGGGFWNEGSGKLFQQVHQGFPFFTKGVTGFVGVNDVVKAMIALTESPVKNERFILVAENWSFQDLFFTIADAFQKKRPHLYIRPWITAIFWRVDWLLTKLTGKKAALSKNSARSAHEKTAYSSAKIKASLGFEFEPVARVIQQTVDQFTA